jgi:hypothetical protein
MVKHATIYLRDLSKALRKQDDDAVLREVHFLAAQFTTMEKMMKDKKWNAKYNESVNEGKLDRIGSQLIKDLDKKYKNQKGTISTFNKIKKDLRKKMPRVSDRVAGSIANQYNDFLLDKDLNPKEKLRLMVLTLKGLGMNEFVKEDTKDIAKAKKLSQKLQGIEGKYRKVMYDLSDRLQADDKNHKLQDELIKSYTKNVTSFMRDMIKITKRVK